MRLRSRQIALRRSSNPPARLWRPARTRWPQSPPSTRPSSVVKEEEIYNLRQEAAHERKKAKTRNNYLESELKTARKALKTGKEMAEATSKYETKTVGARTGTVLLNEACTRSSRPGLVLGSDFGHLLLTGLQSLTTCGFEPRFKVALPCRCLLTLVCGFLSPAVVFDKPRVGAVSHTK